MLSWTKLMLLLIIVIGARCDIVHEDVAKLPYCVDDEDIGYVLVSTLDGKISALQANGNIAWQMDTGNGPLLQSSIHNVELTNQGEMVRIIPSLSGGLYKFNGKTIDAIPIDADALLKSSFVYSSDTVIAGKREVQTFGVIARTGDVLYECSSDGCRNITEVENEFNDIIVIERSTATIRAHEPRSGHERWNFSVGYHNIKIPPASCINLDSAITSLNITAILPEGILSVTRKASGEHLWRHVFEAPIVKIWKWDGRDLYAVDVFASSPARQDVFALTLTPAIYLGMHNKQLYIHESVHIRGRNVGITSFPWKPIPAGRLQDEVDDATAISVLYSSNYVDGNGYYLYSENDQRKNIFCEGINSTSKFFPRLENVSILKSIMVTIVFVIITAVAMQFKTISAWFNKSNEAVVTKESQFFETGVTEVSSTSSVYNDARPIQSHFLDNFDIISQLGKGGYGIVFEVQQKIDKANYAVKIIPLPQKPMAKERVLREVRALAKLDHPNIVRYSTSWDEDALPDLNHVRQAIIDESFFSSDIYEEESELVHAKISIEPSDHSETGTQEEDSFIVFENETRPCSDSSRVVHQDSTHATTKSYTSDIQPNTRGRKLSMKSKERRYLFIQMQLCDKRTLKHWLNETTNRHSKVIYDIYTQILRAVEYIHSMKLIHRDLKPSNIFFNASGIKVGDFGLVTPMQDTSAHCMALGKIPNGHTRDTGTALYMSPEQKQGSQYNYKVDIFSLGVILFELLIYFDTESERIHALHKLREGHFPETFQSLHDLEFKLLKRMLSSKPIERPTVSEVMREIEGYKL